MKLPATLNQTLARVAREVFEALQADDRDTLKWGLDIGDRRVTIGMRAAAEDAAPAAADLPEALRHRSRPATREVYYALRDLRDDVGPDAVVRPADVKAWMERNDTLPNAQSIHTINHALKDLFDRDLAFSHPARGWVLGCRQPSLPISGGQTDRPPAPELRAYASGMADAGVRRFAGAALANPQRVWVPGELSEYGVLITDLDTGEPVAVAERTGRMQVLDRSGRLRSVPAARGELVSADRGRAVVRFARGVRATVRVLGDWQLRGETAPGPDEPAVA